jgi:hypothetical protein
MKIKSGRPVEVEWLDTNQPLDKFWMTDDDLVEWSDTGMLMKSVGYFLCKDDKYFRLYGDGMVESQYESLYSRVQAIPTGCIVNVRKL